MRSPSRLMALLVASLLLAVIGLAVTPTAQAAGEVTYGVMNTSEQPPDGVWFRNSPLSSDTDRITGLGIYAGEQIAADCWKLGEAVGQYGNTVWYHARNLNRPTAGGRTNAGYVNTHYVNDGLSAGQHDSRLSECGVPPSNSTPGAPKPAADGTYSTYYSPFELLQWDPSGDSAVRVSPLSEWKSSVQCDPTKTRSTLSATTTNLSGWSIGRLGPVYALTQASPAQLDQIKNVLMIDPGTYQQMRDGCDNMLVAGRRPGAIVTGWLKSHPYATFVVLAGQVTEDADNKVNGRAHAGIQNFYFNDVRAAGSAVRSRVLVCNYNVPRLGRWIGYTSHQAMFMASQGFLKNPPTNSCPALPGVNYKGSWHP